MRGRVLLESVSAVLQVFGEKGDNFVVVGGCVPAFYARPEGAALRPTKDVDCVSTVRPWILQEQVLAEMCAFGQLEPIAEVQFRYRVPGTDLLIDILSADGLNIGGGTKWLRKAADNAIACTLPDGRVARVVTPPYFVVLKLGAFLDRGDDLLSAKDMEDLVCIAVEVDDLVDQVAAAGLGPEIAALWQSAFKKHSASEDFIPDLVASHVHRDDADRTARATAILIALATHRGE